VSSIQSSYALYESKLKDEISIKLRRNLLGKKSREFIDPWVNLIVFWIKRKRILVLLIYKF